MWKRCCMAVRPHCNCVVLDAVSALIIKVDDMEQQSDTARTEAAIRGWWARQQR
jgi:hypothetical protein